LITLEEWTTIRYLKAQGLGTRKIAHQLGISRNKVRRALSWSRRPRYERPPRPNSKLEPFRDVITQMLVKDRFIGSRILKEIRGRGYDGSQTAFYDCLARIKVETGKSKASMRFETAPGQQAQFDWSPYTVPIGGCLTKVIIFRLIMGFSRSKRHFASLNETQASVFEGIEKGLWQFGGAPRELVVDNARVFINNANRAHFEWNPRFLELCGHYSMRPVACRVRNPRAKGKVERPFFYLEQHFIKGRSFNSFEHFYQELARFEEQNNAEVHQTTRDRPVDRFQLEKEALSPLPAGRFISSQETFRHVSWDSLVAFEGSRYSIPSDYAGKNVWVRTSQGRYLDIYSQEGKLIFRHPLSMQKGATVLVKEHYEKLRKDRLRTRVMLEKDFLERFPDQRDFLEKLYAQQKINLVFHLKPIMELAYLYPKEALISAFAVAQQYNTFSCHFIRGILEKEAPPAVAAQPRAGSLWQYPPIKVKTDLASYQRLVEVRG
jgi:transposase